MKTDQPLDLIEHASKKNLLFHITKSRQGSLYQKETRLQLFSCVRLCHCWKSKTGMSRAGSSAGGNWARVVTLPAVDRCPELLRWPRSRPQVWLGWTVASPFSSGSLFLSRICPSWKKVFVYKIKPNWRIWILFTVMRLKNEQIRSFQGKPSWVNWAKIVLLMCLDSTKPSIGITDMATYSWMYSRTLKKQQKNCY